uniref:BPTI/Kunitz inhibitor domain-containing protein n=1 Tax=Glossina brevipalpis TaxID=37001 RepID=A0A1A9WUS8_9MUSC
MFTLIKDVQEDAYVNKKKEILVRHYCGPYLGDQYSSNVFPQKFYVFIAIADVVCVLPDSVSDNGEKCIRSQAFWSYRVAINDCIQLIYFGFGYNENTFLTQKECE